MRRTGKRRSGPARGLEIEVKLRVADRRELVRRLRRLGARITRARTHERNALYDFADGSLTRRGEMLRLRVETPAGRGSARARPGAVLTFKGRMPEGAGGRGRGRGTRYKVREEREAEIADAKAMEAILAALGLRVWFQYEKFRTTYRLPGVAGVSVEVDETPIGDFVELEGTRRGIDRAAALLGYSQKEYITRTYGALYAESRGRAAAGAAMVFGASKGKAGRNAGRKEPGRKNFLM